MKTMKTTYGIIIITLVALVVGGGIVWYANSFTYPSAHISIHATTSTSKPNTPPSTSNRIYTPAKKSVVVPMTATTTVATTTPAVPSTTPTINSFSPASASVGDQVTIIGTNFSLISNNILFGVSTNLTHKDGTPDNLIASMPSPDGKTLTFIVPTNGPSGNLCDSTNHCIDVTPTGFSPGNYPVVVSNANGVSTSTVFTIITKR